MAVPRITATGLKDKLDAGDDLLLLDVRSDGAYSSSTVRIPGSVRVAVADLPGRAGGFDPARPVVAYCT